MAPSWVSTSISVYYKVRVNKRNKLLKPISTVYFNNNSNNNNNDNDNNNNDNNFIYIASIYKALYCFTVMKVKLNYNNLNFTI